MIVPYVDLGAQWKIIENDALKEISRILGEGNAILDAVVEELEEALAKYLNLKNCISLNSGTDALLFGLKCLGVKKGDEIITVANSFIASVAAIIHVGAIPIFVDVGADHLIDIEKIESLISSKTVAIMPVHLEGKMCDMLKISQIAKKYQIAVIEDAAQSFGSHRSGFMPGQLSDLACFSFHPLKNLNASGDGGFIATNNKNLADRVKRLRNHGLMDRDTVSEFGFVSRLDSIQAAILKIRLGLTDEILGIRRSIAHIYDAALDENKIVPPKISGDSFHSYHLYVIEVNNRNFLQESLNLVGVQTKIHYPKLICDQPAFLKTFSSYNLNLEETRKQSKRILSIPVHQHLNAEQIEFVIDQINKLAIPFD